MCPSEQHWTEKSSQLKFPLQGLAMILVQCEEHLTVDQAVMTMKKCVISFFFFKFLLMLTLRLLV